MLALSHTRRRCVVAGVLVSSAWFRLAWAKAVLATAALLVTGTRRVGFAWVVHVELGTVLKVAFASEQVVLRGLVVVVAVIVAMV